MKTVLLKDSFGIPFQRSFPTGFILTLVLCGQLNHYSARRLCYHFSGFPYHVVCKWVPPQYLRFLSLSSPLLLLETGILILIVTTILLTKGPSFKLTPTFKYHVKLMVENTKATPRSKKLFKGMAYSDLTGCLVGTFAYGILHQLASSFTYYYTY